MSKMYGFVGVLAMLSGPAVAQAPVCERLQGVVCGPAKAAWLGRTLGDVTVLARSAAKAIPVGADNVGVALVEGDLVVARDGSSEIDLGPDCLVAVPQRSSALVYRSDAAQICVSVTDLTPAAAPVTAGVSPLIYGAGGLALIGGGVAAVVMSKKGNSTPSTPVSGQ